MAATAFAASEPLSTAHIREFLAAADAVAWEPIGLGVTDAWRVTLSDGTVTHDAAFQSIDVAARRVGGEGRPVADSFRHNIAAYRLAVLIGLSDMMPVTDARTLRDTPGALTWWVDDVRYDEQTRLEQRRWPPDLDAWGAQIDRMWLFAELVHDTDRHGRNLLYTQDWKLYMIDFTRAFDLSDELMKPYRLRRIDGSLLSRLEGLRATEVSEATAPYLNAEQVAAVLQRRDTLVEHFHALLPEG